VGGLVERRRRFAPHQLRHAHAVELAHEGVPLNVIQHQLGHTNLGVTSIYVQGIDNAEIIATVHARLSPMIQRAPDLDYSADFLVVADPPLLLASSSHSSRRCPDDDDPASASSLPSDSERSRVRQHSAPPGYAVAAARR